MVDKEMNKHDPLPLEAGDKTTSKLFLILHPAVAPYERAKSVRIYRFFFLSLFLSLRVNRK